MPLSIVTQQKDLLRILERVAPVADAKSSIPMLANVLLAAKDGKVTLSATDLYIGASSTCACEVTKQGTIGLPAKALLARIKAMPEGAVSIVVADDSQATIKAVGQTRKYVMSGLAADDYPKLPEPNKDAPLTIAVDLFAALMAHTHFSISPDLTQAHINSALFEWSGDIVRMVSTDGHRLSKFEAKQDRDGLAKMLITLKAIGELRRLCDANKGAEMTIRRDAANAFFDVAGFRFFCKLIDQDFPPYNLAIPKKSAHTVNVPRLALIDALKAVSLSAETNGNGVMVTLTKGAFRVTATGPASGSASDEVPIDFAGEDVSVGVNAKYMLDAMSALDCESVDFGTSVESAPMTVRAAGGNAACVWTIAPQKL